jgi:hypothetical protein
MYATLPVGRFIQLKIEESGMRKVDIVRLCGWGNIDKGLRRIDGLIHDSMAHMEVLEKLVVILNLDKEELNRHIRLENIILGMEYAKAEIEKRTNWVPFISALTELSRPRSITMAAVSGGDKGARFIDVPSSVPIMPFEEQISEVGNLLRTHFEQHEGKTHFFGKIVGYLYNYTYDYSVELSITGEVVGEKRMHVEPSRTELIIGNKTIEGGLFS